MFSAIKVLKLSLLVANLDIRVFNLGNFGFAALDVAGTSLFVYHDASRQVFDNSLKSILQNRSTLFFWYLELVFIALVLDVLDAEDELSI